MRRPGLTLVTIAILGFVAQAAVAVQLAQAATPPREAMLASVEWLAEHVADPGLVLLHVGDKAEYETAHLPGAQYVAARDLAAPPSPGALGLELPQPDAIRATLEKLGISDSSRIVVYFGKDWVTPATRVYFTLDYFGLGDRSSLLDGGMPAWQAQGKPTTAELRVPVRGRLTNLRPNPDLVASAEWLQGRLRQAGVAVVDARLPRFFEGEESGGMPRAGRIPGAKNIPFSTLVTEPDNKLKDRAALEEILKAAGATESDTVVSYCHIGQQATLVYFAARYTGRAAKLYDGSWQEWSRREELPIEP